MIKTEDKINFTSGIIWKQLFLYFIPILAGGLFQQFYATADAIILGQFAGKNGLAAIDSITNLLKLPVNFFVGLSTGAAIIISQIYGSKDEEKLSNAVYTACIFSFIGGIVLSVVSILLSESGLRMMKVPNDIFSLTSSYARIYFAGLSVSMIYNVASGILRAIGDSKTPFKILVCSTIANILLDLLFVAVLKLSAPGAAIATLFSQALSACLALKSLNQYGFSYHFFNKNIQFYSAVLKRIFTLGLPIALQSSLYPIANMIVQSSVNKTGTNNIVAWALCGKLDFLIWLVADSFGAVISTFVAQNIGANQKERALKGVNAGLKMTLGMVFSISLVLFFFSEPLGRLILNAEDAAIASITQNLMHLMAPLYFLYVFGEIYAGAIRGSGESFYPMILTFLATCATRVLWVILFPSTNLMQIILIYPISWALTTFVFIIYYSIYKKKLLKDNILIPLKV